MPESIEVLKIHITQAAQDESKGMLSAVLRFNTGLAVCTERSTESTCERTTMFDISVYNKIRAMIFFS
jgi:hypothetical protein